MESKYFVWENVDEVDTMVYMFQPVEFIADFGIFKIGDKFSWIEVNYKTGMLMAENFDGEIIIQMFELVPVST